MKPQGYYDLLEAFTKDRCAVCHVLEITTERFITYLLADRVIDDLTHRGVKVRRGLCNQHISELFQRKGIVLPLAIYYKAAMDEIVKEMAALPTQMSQRFGRRLNGAALADRLAPSAPCLICADMERQEARSLRVLCDFLGQSPMKEAYQSSPGLCLPHLIKLLHTTQDALVISLVIDTQRRLWMHGANELDEFIAKLNHARRAEPKGHEGGSLRRAIEWMAGLAGVFGQDPR